MNKLRLSIVFYLNSLPLSWGFIHGNERNLFELDFSPPSRCADLLADGQVDIGLIPAIEYQRIPNLKVVPGLSVACKNRVRSVLLLSKVPVERIKTLAADSSSRTSVCLLRILLRMRFRTEPSIEVCGPKLEAMLKTHDAALIIGDVALRANTEGFFCYDLAQEWRSLTGKPFVFAFWGVRDSIRFSDSSVFQKSLNFGKAHLEQIISEQSRRLELPEKLIRDYLTENIDYSLDSENLEGLQLFYEMAEQCGLINSKKGVEYI
jgi:chorismate dehydratase